MQKLQMLAGTVGLLLALTLQARDLPLNVVTLASGDWPPFAGQSLFQGGFCEHVVKRAFELVGYEVVTQHFPWRRAYHYVETGQFDATPCWVSDEERRQLFHFSAPLMTQSTVFFHPKTVEVLWETPLDLARGGYRIGGVAGYSYGFLTDAVQAGILTLDLANDEETNFRKLIRGRIDLYPVEVAVGYHILNQRFSLEERELLMHDPRILNTLDYFLLISRKLPESRGSVLVEKFNEGLQQLRDTGHYQAMEAALLAGDYSRETE